MAPNCISAAANAPSLYQFFIAQSKIPRGGEKIMDESKYAGKQRRGGFILNYVANLLDLSTGRGAVFLGFIFVGIQGSLVHQVMCFY